MKLHHLRLQAFGPFAGVEEIDFDELGAAGLHLIHGPTGSGKTSILDAICFALFAGVPGARQRHRGSLRSDHAAPDARPEVELEFSVGDRRLRVRRSPDHEVPKKRGTGTRMQRASVVLEERHAGGWTTSAARADEAAQVIDDLLGMALEQFAQVVMLPQGDFAAFLRAKPDERGKLLERLFDITDFRDIEDWLTEHRKQLETAVREADSHRATLFARAQEHLAAVTEPAPEGEAPGEADEVDLDLRAAELAGRSTAAMATADAAQVRSESARVVFDQQRALAALQRQAEQAARALAHLDAQHESMQAAQERLELADRAGRCQPVIAAESRRRAAARTAGQLVADSRQLLDAATDWSVPEPGVGAFEGRLDSLLERRSAGDAALAGHQELISQRSQQRRDLQVAQRALTATEQQAGRLQAALNAAIEDFERQRQARADLAQVAALLTIRGEWHQALSGLRRAVTSAMRAIDQTVHCDQAHRDAQQRWIRAEETVIALRSRRVSGIAAELAGGLRQGEPCPVCGSCEHPHRATPDEKTVTPEQVDAAEQSAVSARQVADEHSAARSTARGIASAALTEVLDQAGHFARIPVPGYAELDDDPHAAIAASVQVLQPGAAALARDTDQLDAQVPLTVRALADLLAPAAEQAAREVRDAETAAREVTNADREIEAARQRLEIDHQEIAAARESVVAARTRVQEATTRLSASEERLQDMLEEHRTACGCTTSADVLAGHSRVAGLLDDLLAAVRKQVSADQEARDARAELEAVLAECGFDTAAAAAEARMTPVEATRLAQQLESARTTRAKATGVLEQPDVATAVAAPPAEVATAERELHEAERLAKSAYDDARTIERAHLAVQRIAAEAAEAERKSAPLRARSEVATRIAAAVTGGGENALRMRLTSYVLAARLETVTALANEKLAVMTDGRYRLEHTDELAARGGKSGLGLRVRDAWTGQTRDTATLSGGESFMASLALALGLGEAVLEAAGGRHLETLLVDEGFGSLDDETLELVMTVLDQLRAGGRSVGIVSHVPELRTRIPAQVQVRKTATGSTLEVRGGDAAEVA
ncbi:AAA family ATPase [Flexivirga meconopsidis]|uniref:AAA family ATPase n=1 Tax=Flexivirga meconopsidis TaxID=2977121 RepID=UPI00223FB3FF|nr:SMC family ATPase [Flexivirga meconopsidis]